MLEQGCPGHGKVMELLEFMEKSWNFEIKTESHGKVSEFDQQVQHSINRRRYAATY